MYGLSVCAVLLTFQLTTQVHIITQEGQALTTVFDGLKPTSRRLPPLATELDSLGKQRIIRKGIPIAGSPGACLLKTQGGSCPPTTSCADHHQLIVELPPGQGCSDPVACPTVRNAVTDVNQDFRDGAQDSYCCGLCAACLDSEPCDNP